MSIEPSDDSPKSIALIGIALSPFPMALRFIPQVRHGFTETAQAGEDLIGEERRHLHPREGKYLLIGCKFNLLNTCRKFLRQRNSEQNK